MNPTTPSEFNFAIQNAIESTFNLIVAQCGEDIKFDWVRNLPGSGGGFAAAFVDRDLTKTRDGRYILDRLNNALNAFSYEVHPTGSGEWRTGGEGKTFLDIRISKEIEQDASEAQYGDFCDREEEQLQKSGRIY